MKRGLKLGIFVLVAILSTYFVIAASWNLAPSTSSAGSTISMIAFNVSSNTETNSSNLTNFSAVQINITGTAYSGVKNVTNVSISNGTSGFTFYNDSFTTSPVNVTLNVNISTTSNNWTVRFTLNSSATYNKTVGANVTLIYNRSSGANNATLNFSALPYNSSLTTIAESTAPVATATCSPSIIYEGEAFPCTCSGTDSGDAASGVATSSESSSSGSITDTTLTGSFTYTCTITDNSGNSASDTKTYTILNIGGGSAAVPKHPQRIHSFSKITAGVVGIVKDFDSQIGVKEIQISVNNDAQNVQVTVTKYDEKPAEVSVSKSGKVYQYLQVDAKNLGNKLDKANVQFRVEKSWASSNNLKGDEISVYKFNEGTSKWDRLQTTFASEDNTYYYYNVEVNSFSYFSIGEGVTVTSPGAEPQAVEKKGSMTFVWILIALVVVAVIWSMSRKKSTDKKR